MCNYCKIIIIEFNRAALLTDSLLHLLFYDCALLPFYMNDIYFPCRQTVQVVTSRCCTGPCHYPSRYE